MKKIFVLLLIAAIAATVFVVRQKRLAAEAARRESATLDYYGNVEIRRVNLGFRVGGRIAEFLVDEGDVVRAGDVLAKLDVAPLEAEALAARARVEAATATLERLENGSRPQEIDEARMQTEEYAASLKVAEAELKRNADLVDKNAVSRSDYDAALATRDVAAARLKRSQATLSLLEEGSRREDVAAARAGLAEAKANATKTRIALDDAVLLAPNAGTLLTRVAEPGAVVAAGQTIATFSVQDVVWAYIYVEEPELGRVVPGAKAEIRTDSSSKVYSGVVGFVSPEAEFTPKSVETPNLRTNLVYRTRIVVENPDDGLRQGAPVDVRIFAKTDADVATNAPIDVAAQPVGNQGEAK